MFCSTSDKIGLFVICFCWRMGIWIPRAIDNCHYEQVCARTELLEVGPVGSQSTVSLHSPITPPLFIWHLPPTRWTPASHFQLPDHFWLQCSSSPPERSKRQQQRPKFHGYQHTLSFVTSPIPSTNYLTNVCLWQQWPNNRLYIIQLWDNKQRKRQFNFESRKNR